MNKIVASIGWGRVRMVGSAGLICILVAGCQTGKRSIPADRYLSHISVLASDDFEGRGTGSKGIDLAAGYIAGQFAAAGIQPGGPNGSYFQDYSIAGDAKLLDDTRMSISGVAASQELKKDYIPMGFSGQGEFDGDVVFAGYGIRNPDKQHDDYAAVDVKGKIVLMIRREPKSWSTGRNYTDHSRFDTKVRLAAEQGASGVFIVNQVPEDPNQEENLSRFSGSGSAHSIPVVQVSRKLADAMLTTGGLPPLAEAQKSLDSGQPTTRGPLNGIRASGKVAYESDAIAAKNVVGLLPAKPDASDEYVVIGAHYDHLGIRRDRIHNGADDNASGTAGVIELARSLAKEPVRKRNVVFITFSGEEMGLYGSEHYASEPTVPIKSIVAMINMDMIGRWDPSTEANTLEVHGLGTGDNFKSVVERTANRFGIKYRPEESALGPSDHASFYKAGVPSLFFFTGLHADYHRPSDDIEKINAEGGAKILGMVQDIVRQFMNAETRPVFAKVDRPAQIPGRTGVRDDAPVMGLMPDFEDESNLPGWRIAEVFPNGGAAKGGMLAGDRVLSVNGKTITDFGDYQGALAEKKAGDVIPVVVKRGDQELTLQVELQKRG